MFSNLRGCDGQRVFFNGCSCIALNGGILNRSQQFGLSEVVSVCNCSCFNYSHQLQYRNNDCYNLQPCLTKLFAGSGCCDSGLGGHPNIQKRLPFTYAWGREQPVLSSSQCRVFTFIGKGRISTHRTTHWVGLPFTSTGNSTWPCVLALGLSQVSCLNGRQQI